jgi:hypothetical protein
MLKRVIFYLGLLSFVVLVVVFYFSIGSVQETILRENPEVKTVNDINEGYFDYSLKLDIVFYDGRILRIEGLNRQLKGDIRIERIGDYGFHGYTDHYGHSPYLYKKIIENEIGIKIKGIKDIISNYNNIYTFVKNLEDINSGKYSKYDKGTSWVWSVELRGINFKTYEFKGERYVIFREDWTSKYSR